MIVNSLPAICDGNFVRLRPENRAPLGLARGTTAFAIRRPQSIDFALSPFAPDFWSDLWQIEIQLHDRRGQLAGIVKVFDEYGLQVLSQESRKAADEDYAVKHFAVWAGRYTSKVDGSFRDRERDPRGMLDGLRKLLLGEFLTDLRLTDGLDVRLTVNRNWPHYYLARTVDFVPGGSEEPYADLFELQIGKYGWVRLPDELLPPTADKERIVWASTNARSRLLHATQLSTATPHNLASLVVHFSGNDRLMNAILASLSRHSYSIIRSQLRPGWLDREDEPWMDNPYTLNLLVENLGDEEADDPIEAIREFLNTEVGEHEIDVRKPRYWTDDEYPASDDGPAVRPAPYREQTAHAPMFTTAKSLSPLRIQRALSRGLQDLQDEEHHSGMAGAKDRLQQEVAHAALQTQASISEASGDRSFYGRLFLAYDEGFTLSDGRSLLDVVRAVCVREQLEVVTGRHTNGSASIMQNIRAGIESSGLFLAILTPGEPDGAFHVSPWLPFELGVLESSKAHSRQPHCAYFLKHEAVRGGIPPFLQQTPGHECSEPGELNFFAEHRIADGVQNLVEQMISRILEDR